MTGWDGGNHKRDRRIRNANAKKQGSRNVNNSDGCAIVAFFLAAIPVGGIAALLEGVHLFL